MARHSDDPLRLVEADVGAAAPPLEDGLQVREAELGVLSRGNDGLVLEGVRGGQRAEGEQALLVAPHVPGVAIEAVDFDVADDHPDVFEGVALENDAGLVPGDAVATVAADEPLRGDRLGLAALHDRGRHLLRGLIEAAEHRAELDRAAELRQPPPQRLLDPPLGRDQACRVWDVGSARHRIGHRTAPGHLPVRSGRTDRHRHPAVREHAIDDPEILEHLKGARLDALATRAGLRAGGGFDQPKRNTGASELTRQSQACRAGADDQHRGRGALQLAELGSRGRGHRVILHSRKETLPSRSTNTC